MATIAERLSSYATSVRYADLPRQVVHQAKRMMIDTLGCALGGYAGEPSKIARDLADSRLSPAQISRLLDRLWRLEGVEEVGEVIRLTRIS